MMSTLHRKVGLAAAVAVAAGLTTNAANAGQEPYVGTVGADPSIPNFYISPKHKQFTHTAAPGFEDDEGFDTFRVGRSPQDEVCNVDFDEGATNTNYLLSANLSGSFEWTIALPKDPKGNIDIALQCGLLKPNGNIFSVLECAGESGEREAGLCDRERDRANRNSLIASALPKLSVNFKGVLDPTAEDDGAKFLPAFAGTAYRNPGSYGYTRAGGEARNELRNSASLQVLDGEGNGTRVQQKACQTKVVNVKIPVDGAVNANGQTEYALIAGDLVTVKLDFPSNHTMDVFCHAQSACIHGNGNPDTAFGDRFSGGAATAGF